MDWWKVTVKETLTRVVAIKAANAAEAEDKVRCFYRNCDIVLGADDFSGVEITAEAMDEKTAHAPKSLADEITAEVEAPRTEVRAWVEEPAPVSMGQRLRDIIAAHNRMIETIQNAEMTCNLFRGMEVWHKIACEGADITCAARSIGIDTKVNMQSGVIYVNGTMEV